MEETMILSVSRRTDIPAFYGDWFINRLKEGVVYVRNPMNIHQISKIPLSPEKIECIVFWTKNPSEKFIKDLKTIDELGYRYYFQFSVTSYDQKVEVNIPKKTILMERFKQLSNKIGKEKVIWRYDPIFFNEHYNFEYHKKWFEYIAEKLENHTEKCVISFLDYYSKIRSRLILNGIPEVQEQQMQEFAFYLSTIGKKYNIKVESCCEEIDLSGVGIEHGHCIDADLINRICPLQYDFKKDKSQRQACGCIESIDIGSYNTCRNGCIYCYANWKDNVNSVYDPNSPILCSTINPDDKITDRAIKSCELLQAKLF